MTQTESLLSALPVALILAGLAVMWVAGGWLRRRWEARVHDRIWMASHDRGEGPKP